MLLSSSERADNEHEGDNYRTVDGGSGFGADVALSTRRQLAFKPDTGWALGEPTKFGVSFAGGACSEPRLIELAYAFEQATKRRVAPASFP